MAKKAMKNSPSYIPTKRIDFEDGSWWEVYTSPTRGMRKQLRTAGQRSYKLPPDVQDFDPEDPASLRRLLIQHPDSINLDIYDDTLLLVGTAAWSYDMDITSENIDMLPEQHINAVLEQLRVHFAEVTDENLANGVGTSLSP